MRDPRDRTIDLGPSPWSFAIEPAPGRTEPIRPPEPSPRYWAEGRLRLRLIAPDGVGTVAIVGRPFALIGRGPTADLPVPGPGASLRHVYLHLGRRGVFAVDLASRTGTRFDGAPGDCRASWLLPGRGLELAGHRIELIEASPAPGPDLPPQAGGSPLGAAPDLCRLELEPEGHPGHPISMLSELSFLGRSRSCALQAEGDAVARVHAVLVRTADRAFVVDLAGRALTINGGPVALSSSIREGDRLRLGESSFVVRLGPAPAAAPGTSPPASRPAGLDLGMGAGVVLASSAGPGDAIVSRALQAVQDGRDEMLRSNEQFQKALLAVVRQLYDDQATLFDRHLERLDRLQHEVAELRNELRSRLGPGAIPPPRSRSNGLDAPLPPPIPAPRPGEPDGQGRATSWLVDRLGELEEQIDRESRSSWRDLLSRLGPPLRSREDA